MIDRLPELRAMVQEQSVHAGKRPNATSSKRQPLMQEGSLSKMQEGSLSKMDAKPSSRQPCASSSERSKVDEFLDRVEHVRYGALRQLQDLIAECRRSEERTLNSTSVSTEALAMQQVVVTRKRINDAATRTSQELRGLFDLGQQNSVEMAGLDTRQALSGVYVLFQGALNEHFREQEAFYKEVQSKRARHLKILLPDADQSLQDALVNSQVSTAAAFQDSMAKAPQLRAPNSAMMEEALSRNDDLQDLANMVVDLHSAFANVAVIVGEQGMQIDDIASQVARTRKRTEQANVRLEQAVRIRRACERKWLALIIFVLAVVAIIFIVLLVVRQ